MAPILLSKMDTRFRDEVIARVGDSNLRHCLSCGTCSVSCPVREVDKNYNPQRIVRMALLGMKDYFWEKPGIPYACNLCELCKKTCPYGVNIGRLCLVLRQMLVEEGKGPLPPHKQITDEEERVFDPGYTLALPDRDAPETKRVFFPGCHLPAYAPALAIAAYDYVRQKLPGTGVMLRCCGGPYQGIGMQRNFQEKFDELGARMRQVGASEIIVPCQTCFRTLTRAKPDFRVKSLWVLMGEIGAPKPVLGDHHVFSLHDSCTARWEPAIHDGIRKVIRSAGHEIKELRYSRELARCCGMGGLIAPLDLFRVLSLGKLRVSETDCDMLTYCATCRENLIVHRPTLHVLDLIFNPNWKADMTKKANKPAVRVENQMKFRQSVIDRLGRPA